MSVNQKGASVAPTGATITVERGLRIDCRKEGCSPAHADDGEVFSWEPSNTINRHACTVVERTVTTSAWVEVDR